MPDLCRFKRINGYLYCWDRDEKSFCRVDLTQVTGKTELAVVIAAYMDEEEVRQITVLETPAEKNGRQRVLYLSKSIEIEGEYFCLDEQTGNVYEVIAGFRKVKSKSRSIAIKTLIQKKQKGETKP